MNALNGRHVKYIHIFSSKDIKFYVPIVKMINNSKNGFNTNEHIFLTPFKKVYESLGAFENIILDDKTKNWFKEYDKFCDWFITHGYFSRKDGFLLSKRIKNKIVFRYWGGRRPFPKKINGRLFHNMVIDVYAIIYKIIYRYIYGHFALFGIANIVDQIDLNEVLYDKPMMRMPYASEESKDYVTILKNQHKIDDGKIRIIIGHRSDKNEHHIKFIDLLQRFADENIEIFIPLSYGDMKYAQEVKNHIMQTSARKVKVIDELMEKNDYLKLLRDMDIAIIDGETSCALGNISYHVQFENTVFLSRTGLIKKAFELERIPFHCVDEIEKMSFSEFSKILLFDGDKSKEFGIKPYDRQLVCWKNVLTYLDEKKYSFEKSNLIESI